MRRETARTTVRTVLLNYFNPLPPCGGRRKNPFGAKPTGVISIHSLRAEGDERRRKRVGIKFKFQSTPSVRRETTTPATSANTNRHFNPLPPCGGRLALIIFLVKKKTFQSTPSVRRETRNQKTTTTASAFQSTPSVRRETPILLFVMLQMSPFQSTPSVRRETAKFHKFSL